jgi:hypothetical protein
LSKHGDADQKKDPGACVDIRWLNRAHHGVGAVGSVAWRHPPERLHPGLRSPHERHRILAARAISDFVPAPDLVLPIMRSLYLNSPTGAWRDELARTLAIIDPALVAELGLPTNRFPTVNRSLRR